MKHLSPDQFAAHAEGLRPMGEAADHLRACGECRRELAELRALVRAVGETPAPSAALRQATLKRLGLVPSRRPRVASLRWAGLLGGALALALLLPQARFRFPAPSGSPAPESLRPTEPSSPETVPKPRARAAKSAAAARGEIAPAGKSIETTTAWTVAQTAPTPAAAAVGAAAPADETFTAAVNKVAVPVASPTPTAAALTLDSVRGNLIRPGTGGRLSFTVSLGQSGPVQALVVDSQGRTVGTLYASTAGPGSLTLEWDGGSAPSGVYTVLVSAGGSSKTFKVLVVR